MNTRTRTKTVSKRPAARFRALEEAREAVVKLRTLKPFLLPQDEETLAILIDEQLMAQLDQSLQEATEGKLEPLKNS